MEINKDNYEIFFLDYYENRLDPTQVAEMLLFLEQNPELLAEFESYDTITLSPEEKVIFPDKNSLKKNTILSTGAITASNYEEYFISAVENLLGTEELENLNRFLAVNPHLQKDYDLYTKTILVPDSAVIFTGKAALKQAPVVAFVPKSRQRWLYPVLAAAAGLALLITVYFQTGNTPANRQGSVAQNGKEKVLSNTSIAKTAVPEHNSAPYSSSKTTAVKEARVFTSPGHHQIPAQPDENAVLATLEPVVAAHSLRCGELPERTAADSPGFEGRFYFTEIYQYIRLREQTDFQEYMDKEESRSLVARAYNKIKENVFGHDNYEDRNTKPNNGLWALANAGIKGINFVTNSQLKLYRKLDDDGNTTAYAVTSNRFEYSKELKK